MIVLDASVLIGHLNRQDARHLRAEALLAGLDPAETLGASVITLAEAMSGPARAGGLNLDIARQAIERLSITEIAWGQGAALLLARLRAATLLKMPDCWVLAAAEQVNGVIATFDEALAGTAREQGIAVLE